MIAYQCPTCKSPVVEKQGKITCPKKHSYPITNSIVQFVQDQNTETWDKYWKRIPVYDTILDVLRKIMNVQLRRYLEKNISPTTITLEPGGGSAFVSAMLAEKGYVTYAMDYASIPLKIAQEQLKSKAILVQGDLFNMPFIDESFDLTFNNSTMEHFKNPLDGLKEMARVTKKGGCVFVGVPFTYGPLSVYKLKKSSFKDAWDGTTFDRKRLKQLFQDAGLEVVHSRTFFFRCFIGVLGKKK
ncbi:MAG TPA: methyltransferase domain-containing protein [Candidatus Nanoarchaeia archaeon]|nr:methyltransferase domain-containing protein [Candidatus Nanoarchaeia archaeon]